MHVSASCPCLPDPELSLTGIGFKCLVSKVVSCELMHSLPKKNAQALVPGSPVTCQPGKHGRHKAKASYLPSVVGPHGEAGWSVGVPGYRQGWTLSHGCLTGVAELEPLICPPSGPPKANPKLLSPSDVQKHEDSVFWFRAGPGAGFTVQLCLA